MTGSCRVRVTVSCRVRVAGRVADCSKPVILLKSSFTTISTPRHFRSSQPPPRFIPKASSSSSSLCRRLFIVETTTVSLSLATPFLGPVQPAKSEDALSEWERVYLPIDPGVVLLDIAFVPDELNHGLFLT
ncbi:hypothetical protein TIFTF001_037175 [Ficus carica]|uniref:Uncharacterized protein n=1 Tax=Ficus carica TaxID=3494 RepID=A0AA88E6L2_FICCA|nr:hypothetical protein TIFTF001_037174 [Ficus carica]GMN68118.1 hypothetical protein TIFTF001_037175 [Ficus carica]